MNDEEFRIKIQEINNDITNIMQNHELINDFDHMTYSIHPCFQLLSDLLYDYIINVNEKITTLNMASFFEEQFPEIIKSDPIIFADSDLKLVDDTLFAKIFRPSYERIMTLNHAYQKQYSIFRYINIFSNISDEINSMEGKSIDLIKGALQLLSLQPIEIEDYI